MCLQPKAIDPIPEETRRVAKAAFPKGNLYMRMRDELGTFFSDEQFTFLFAQRGQPGYSPWRLALVCLMQYVENLSDRQAAEAVQARIDWKYALSLELTDSGFDYSVLSEFRTRLIDGGIEGELLDTMLKRLAEKGYVKTRGKQRTDSSHVLASIRVLNRLETLGETLRATLNTLATVAPDWLRSVAEPAWFLRYAKRIEDERLPKGKTERTAYAETVGCDGMKLLNAIYSAHAPDWLSQIPAVETLRQTWLHQYYVSEGQLRLRQPKDLPPSSLRCDSPYDTDARYGTKRSTHWTGYKVHLTETCDDTMPRVITNVETTIAPQTDGQTTTTIHQTLADKGQLPDLHLVDNGYISADLIVTSKNDHQVSLFGPVRPAAYGQNRQNRGYTVDDFSIDWEAKTVTCPMGQTTKSWTPTCDANGNDVISIRFSRPGCRNCSAREICTRSAKDSRSLTLRGTKERQDALRNTRQQQKTQPWKEQYALRAGIEGTISVGVRGFGLRNARYIGIAKTHLQHILTACAINISRIDNWLTGTRLAKTRTSRFAKLYPQAA